MTTNAAARGGVLFRVDMGCGVLSPYWETADQGPSLDDAELEWAALWNPLPKVVFSTTLSAVQGNARLASGGPAEKSL